MPPGSSPHPKLALLLILTLASTGCVPRSLDVDQLEDRLGRQLSERLGVSGIVAECPEDVEASKGVTFVCTARAPGEAVGLRIQVTQLDDDGNVTWEIAGAAG